MKYVDKLKSCVEVLLEIIFPRDFDISLLEKEINFIRKNSDVKNFLGTYYLLSYKNKLIKDAVWEMKFRSNKKIAVLFGKLLAKEIAEICEDEKLSKEKILLLPVPIHKKRRDERGFNQCEWLCEEIIKNFAIEYKSNILIRKKYTIKQSWSSKNEREQNLKSIFEINSKYQHQIKDKIIILIDDVITTGSTIKEIERTLSESVLSKIISITIAH